MDCSFCKKEKVEVRTQYSYSNPGGVVICNRCNGEINNMMSLMNKDRNTGTISLADANWATRSEVFKNMLASDACKAAPVDSVSLPEFNHEELEIFLELLYCGNLSKEKFEKHFFCLAVASQKYAIPHLQKFCEEHILKLLDSSTALKVLEISEITSNETLKVDALESILSHSEEIYFSPGYEEFARQNPHLLVHITRAHSISDKKRKV